MNSALVGFTVDTFGGIKASSLLKLIGKAGVEFAEVTPAIFENIEEAVENIHGLKLGFHLPLISEYGFDFSCRFKKDEIDDLIEKINKNHRRLNLQYVLTHPTESHMFDVPGGISEEFLFKNLARLEPPLVLENTLENEDFKFEPFLTRAESALGEKLSGICFDPPHAYMSREDWFSMLKDHYSKIRLLHLSDCTREEDLHRPFGQGGDLPTREILKFLRDNNYEGIINLEILPRSLWDLAPLFSSYLITLRYVNRTKYLAMRLRSPIFMPMLRWRIKKLLKDKPKDSD